MLSGNDKSFNLSEPEISQPVTTALQLALVNLLGSWNIQPKVVVGHSSGEIAAAYCVGGLSFESALRIAYYRGVIATTVKDSARENMGMMSIGLSEAETHRILHQHGLRDHLTVACVNSSSNVTVSGTMSALEVLQPLLQADDVFSRILNVEVAYHSSYMFDTSQTFEESIGTLKHDHFRSSFNIPMVSTVSGQIVSSTELCQAAYWSQNMISPVLFHQAFSGAKLSKEDRKAVTLIEHWVEVGPHPALKGISRQILSQSKNSRSVGYSSVLQRGVRADITALHLAGTLYCLGVDVSVRTINRRATCKVHAAEQMLTDLPPYPFNYTKTHWLESRISKNYRFGQYTYNPYLGSRALDWNPLQARWRNRISVASHPWLKDHKVSSTDYDWSISLYAGR